MKNRMKFYLALSFLGGIFISFISTEIYNSLIISPAMHRIDGGGLCRITDSEINTKIIIKQPYSSIVLKPMSCVNRELPSKITLKIQMKSEDSHNIVFIKECEFLLTEWGAYGEPIYVYHIGNFFEGKGMFSLSLLDENRMLSNMGDLFYVASLYAIAITSDNALERGITVIR